MDITPRVKGFGRTAFAVAVLAVASQPAWAASGDPSGAPFIVNTTTAGQQEGSAVARSASGQRIVVWDNLFNIYAQRYAADGSRLGGELQVNASSTPGGRGEASVAADAAGNFIVAWSGPALDGMVFRRFTANGAPAGGEVKIADAGEHPSIAMDADGDIAAAWSAADAANGGRRAIYARRFGPDGSPQGAVARVSPRNAGNHFSPEVAMSADGDYVVAWSSYGMAGSVLGTGYLVLGGAVVSQSRVWTRHYEADGRPRAAARPAVTVQASEFVLTPGGNPILSGHSVAFDIGLAMDAQGDYVVAWSEDGYGRSAGRVQYRRYRADDRRSPIARITSLGADLFALHPAVAFDGTGNLVVTWAQFDPHSSGAANTSGVFYRQYGALNAALAPVRLVPTTDLGFHEGPAVSVEPGGAFTIYRTSGSPFGDGDGSGVLGQAFEGP